MSLSLATKLQSTACIIPLLFAVQTSAATILFDDDFQDTAVSAPTSQADLNVGVAVGTWTVTTLEESFVQLALDGADHVLTMDQGNFDITANFAQESTLALEPKISMEVGLRRRSGNNKHNFIDGFDADDNRLFSIRLNGDEDSNSNEVAYSTDGSTYTDLEGGLVWQAPAVNSTNMKLVEIALDATGWDLWFDADDDGTMDAGEFTTDLSFIASPTAGLTTLQFTGESSAGARVDDILASQVPEPSSLAIAVLGGLIGLIGFGRRRKR